MTEAKFDPAMERYLARVRRGLACLNGAKRTEIIEELTDSLLERARSEGGAGDEFQATAVALAEPPGRVAGRYRDLYGFGLPCTLLAVLLTTLAAFVSGPQNVEREGLFLLASLAFLLLPLYFSLAGGWRAGLAAGLAGGLVRLLGLAVALGGEIGEQADSGLFVGVYLLVSLTGVILGYLPGRVKRDYLERYGWLE